MKKEHVSGPNLVRGVSGDVSILDEKARRFTLSWASDDVAALRRSFFDDPWIETLGMDKEEVNLSRLDSGFANLLWGHDQYDRHNTVGVIERAWVKDGVGYAECRLSMRDDVSGLWQDIVDKVITNVSTGYQVQERTLTKENKDGPDEYRVTRWLPMEISLVAIPVDDGVGVGRSADSPDHFTITTVTEKEERAMDKTTEAPAAPALEERQDSAVSTDTPETTKGKNDIDMSRSISKATNEALAAERQRCADIRDLAKRADMSDEALDKAIRNGDSVDSFRQAAFDAMAEREVQHRPQITAGTDAVEKQRSAAEDWLMHRAGERPDNKAIDVNGNEFRGMTLMDLAIDRLGAAGVSTRGLDRMEIAKRAVTHSTSDFPVVLGNVFNKVLLNAYSIIPDTWRNFCAVGSVSDFRSSDRYRAGTFGDLDTIPEGGEYKYGTISDAEKNAIRAQTKGKMFSVTRQLLINDDLGALTGILRLMGRGAARTIEKDVYAYLLANGNMADGGALFNSTDVDTAGGHANLASSGAAPSIDSISAMSQAMQTQKFGDDYIDVPPSVFLGPINLAADVQELNDSQYDPASNKFQKPNRVRGLFSTVVGTPRLTGTAWYMFADPNIEPVLEVAFLNGQQTPYTEQREGWNVDGIEYKVRLDYGVGAVGFRGARKNPGSSS